MFPPLMIRLSSSPFPPFFLLFQGLLLSPPEKEENKSGKEREKDEKRGFTSFSFPHCSYAMYDDSVFSVSLKPRRGGKGGIFFLGVEGGEGCRST